jgi:glycosyltransferase involved in cell wall biosynthesis
MKLVSIVTPSFQQSAFLEQTIRSVLDQDYGAIEYLVVDGGSTDGSLQIIGKYADRLAWWVSEKDQGQADAINKGFGHAKGEIIAWLNSDDAYMPGAVSAAVKAFEAYPQAVLIYGDMLAVDEHDQPINNLKYRQVRLADLLCFQIIGQPAVFMRRSAFERAGGLDPTFHFLLDHQLWIKIAEQGELKKIDQTWARARYHPQAKNRLRAAEFGPEAFRILEWASRQARLAPALEKVARRARASAYRLNARYLIDGGQPWPALRAWLRAFIYHPPTALARLNLAGSAVLNLVGLGCLREIILRLRRDRLKKKFSLDSN